MNVEEGDSVSNSGGGSSGSAAPGTATATSSSSAPVSIAAGAELAVKLAVNEVDVPSLKVGQRAELAFDAVPRSRDDRQGRRDTARDGTVGQGVVTYDVWVSLDVENAKLKTGMSVVGNIVTASSATCCWSPTPPSSQRDQGEYVQVIGRGATEPRDVTVATGLKGPSQTVIDSGIEEGAGRGHQGHRTQRQPTERQRRRIPHAVHGRRCGPGGGGP